MATTIDDKEDICQAGIDNNNDSLKTQCKSPEKIPEAKLLANILEITIRRENVVCIFT